MLKKAILVTVLALLAGLVSVPTASAAAVVSQDQTAFVTATGASQIAWPGITATALNTALPIPQPFGVGLGSHSCAVGTLTTPGGEVKVTKTITATTPNYICYIGPDWAAPLTNTSPKPRAATIVANGEDDYGVEVVLATPVNAIGFSLLTNSTASEAVTLTYTDGTTELIADAALGTGANAFEFVGFISPAPDMAIKSVMINTTGGAAQNEGIEGIWLAKDTDSDGVSDPVDNCPAIPNPNQDVVYSVDFLPPFDDSTPSGLIVNKMKNGRVVPVKVMLYDECAQSPVTDPTTNVTIKTSRTSGTGSGDPIEEYADAGMSSDGTNAFRWSTDGFWIYNLDSKALGLIVNNLHRVDVYVDGDKATVDTWGVLQPVK